MRDHRKRNRVLKKQTVYYGNTYCQPDDKEPTFSVHLHEESGRANLTKGNFVTPTYYWSYTRKYTSYPYEIIRSNGLQCRDLSVSPAFKTYYPVLKGDTLPNYRLWQLKQVAADEFRPSVSSNVVGIARNRCLSAISDQKIDLGTIGGEMIKEAGSLTDLAVKFGKALSLIKAKKYKKALRQLGFVRGSQHKGLSDNYLAFVFGLKPIYTTMMELHSGITSALVNDSLLVSVRGAHTADDGAPLFSGSTHYEVSGNRKHGAQVGVLYEIENYSKRNLQQLGAINPLTVAWNISSLSFIVDWFVSIGTFLNGLSAPQGLSFKSGYLTTFIETKLSFDNIFYRDYSNGYYRGTFPKYDVYEKAMERQILTTWPRPAVTISLGLSAGKMVTLGALASSLLL